MLGYLSEPAIEGIAAVPVGREVPEIGLSVFNMGYVEKSTYSNAANIKSQVTSVNWYWFNYPYYAEIFIEINKIINLGYSGIISLFTEDNE